MGWRRHALVAVLAFLFTAGSGAGPALSPPAEATLVHEVRAGRVSAVVPSTWESRPLDAGSGARRGIQASGDLSRWPPVERHGFGLEAYWVNAATVGVPSDYYYLAAGGPATTRLPMGQTCTRDTHRVLRDRRPVFDRRRHSPGDYVATANGTCAPRGRTTRWASFVAAPGFGPVATLGIPESGLYVALVMVPEGPRALARAERLLSWISFDDTFVSEFLVAAAGGGPAP